MTTEPDDERAHGLTGNREGETQRDEARAINESDRPDLDPTTLPYVPRRNRRWDNVRQMRGTRAARRA